MKPIFAIVYFTIEPSRKLAQMIYELSVKILNAPFNAAFVRRIRRMSKMRLNTLTNDKPDVIINVNQKPVLLAPNSNCSIQRILNPKNTRSWNTSLLVVLNAVSYCSKEQKHNLLG